MKRITMPPQHEIDAARLIDRIAKLGRCVIGYSGGVDSAVVAAAALRADQQRWASQLIASNTPIHSDSHSDASIAVTADSPSVSREQLDTAIRVANEMGVRHEIIQTTEIEREDYRANDRRRCFYCKQTLYTTLAAFAANQGISAILSGTNADDLGDYRPGIEAGHQAGVVAPLAMLGVTKERVRAVAKHWCLSVFDRPAQPCLSSRIAYGVAVSHDRLRKIEQAEAFLRNRDYSPLRVRLIENDQAKIEVSLESLDRLTQPQELSIVTDYLLSIGFTAVSVDPLGFRSGSMNLVQLAPRPACPSPRYCQIDVE
jgi:uncharacterized protein